MAYRLKEVDLRHLEDSERRIQFVTDVCEGFLRDGFVVVRGLQNEFRKMRKQYAEARDILFALNDEFLNKYSFPHGQRGFTGFQVEHARDMSPEQADLKRMWMTRLEEWPEDMEGDCPFGPNVWPQEVPWFQERALRYLNMNVVIGRILLRAIATGFGKPEDCLVDMTLGSETMLRSLHYPPVTAQQVESGATRSSRHTDINLITVLPSEPGLYLVRSDGEQLFVEPRSDCLLADTGDMLPEIPGFESLQPTEHGVVVPRGAEVGKPRYTDPCFIHARRSLELRPKLLVGDWVDQRLKEIGFG